MSKRAIQSIVITAAAVFSSLATAGGLAGYPESQSNDGPGKTRAQVVEEMTAAKRNEVVGDWRQVDTEAGWVFIGSSAGSKSRVEVLRELEAFQRDRSAQAGFNALYGAS